MKNVKITWLGHACFEISGGGYTVVTDPFEDGSVNGIGNVRTEANAVYCSHSHHDHNAVDCVTLKQTDAQPPIVSEISTFHDGENGAKRGANTVRVFDFDGVRVGHFGDLGHALSEEQIKEIGKLDAALMPVGGFYTIDAETAKTVFDKLGAKIMIPMHYRTDDFGFPVIAHIDDVVKALGDVTATNSSELTVGEDTRPGIYVLTPKLMQKK